MADGRDEVGAARDWLRAHGVVVPSGAVPSEGASRAPVEGSGGGRAAPGARDARRSYDDESGVRAPLRVADRAHGADDADWADETHVPADGLEGRNGSAGRDERGGARGDRRRGGRRRSGAAPARGDGEDVDGRSAGRRSRGGSTVGRRPDGRGEEDRDGDGPDADPEQVARTIVLRKLTAQARTRAELERALRTKDVPDEAACAVLDRMGEVGLVDDAAFARDWVSSRQQRRHLSRTALRRELQTKGVDRDVIDEALAEVGGADEHRAALDLARRKASSMGSLPREVAYRRLGGVLARRGFSASITAGVLSEVLDGADQDD